MMPDELFEKKVKETRELFLKMQKPFPKDVTRRELLRLIEELIKEM